MPASVPRPIPVVIDIPNEMYFRPEGSELVLVGLEDDNQMGGDPDRETATAAVAFHDRAAERIVRRVPGLIDGTFRTSHSGQDGLTTTDQRPLLGPAGPEASSSTAATAGRASRPHPAVGLGMAEWILDGAPRSVDLAPFAYTRVAEGRVLEGEHGGAPVWR